MNYPKKLILAGFFLFLSLNLAHANLLYVSGALKAGFGSTSTTDTTTVPSTSMAAYSAEGSLGFRLYHFILLGASGEYSLRKQLTNPSKVSNINTQGRLTAVYPMLGFDMGSLRIIAKLPSLIAGDYALDKANFSGQKVKYSDADALCLQLHWKRSGGGLVLPYVFKDQYSDHSTFWGIEYQSLKFKKMSLNGTESSLTAAQQFNMKSYSLLYGFFF